VPCLSRELPVRRTRTRTSATATCSSSWPSSRRTPATDIAYLCGNPDMVDATFEALKEAGLPVPQVRREKYVSSK
jgi:NAD(P)H-flavin reductase